MKLTNLLPKSEQREVRLAAFAKSQLVFWLWIVISTAVLIILALLARVYLQHSASIAAAQVETEKGKLKTANNEQLKAQVEALNLQINGIDNLESQHMYWSKALIELGNLLPQDASMDLISIDRPSGKIDIKGTASRVSVLKFWSDIHKSKYFKNINFPLANLDQAQADAFTFTFYANFDNLKQP